MKEIKVKRLESIDEIDELKPLEDVVEVRIGPGIYHRFLGLYAGRDVHNIPIVIQQEQSRFPIEREYIWEHQIHDPSIEEGAIFVDKMSGWRIGPDYKEPIYPGDRARYDIKKKEALQRIGLWNGELVPRKCEEEGEND